MWPYPLIMHYNCFDPCTDLYSGYRWNCIFCKRMAVYVLAVMLPLYQSCPVSLSPPAGRCPAALRTVCSCWRTGHPSWRPGQRDQAAVGWQRHTELLCAVTRVPAQWLCSIVSVNLLFYTVIPLRDNKGITSSFLLKSIIFNILLTFVGLFSTLSLHHYKCKCG